MIVTVRNFKISVVLLTLVVGMVLPERVSGSGIGFQAVLDAPPRVVSAYDDPPNRFSGALESSTFEALSPLLLYSPKVQGSSFDNNSIRLGTTYHHNNELVPVSVDAQEYFAYRVGFLQSQASNSLVQRSLNAARLSGRRKGFSFGVALPKRFDQMFGQGGANLRVTGYRRITFSGKSQWNDNARSGVARQSKFPSLNMEQISRFSITGTIGSKITVSVSQDNQTDIPLANRLLLRYKGDDDDIIKVIEAGNTNLALPNTRFVGYSKRIQGLFGLKAEAQLGKLRVIGIASQEKGSSESATITATGEENANYIRDYAYSEGRIFDLGYGPNALYPGSPAEIGPLDSIVNILVFKEERREDNLEAREAELLIDPTDPSVDSVRGDRVRVSPVDADGVYELYYVPDNNRSPVAIVFYARQRHAIGVYMEIKRFDVAGDFLRVDTIGHIGGTDTLKYIRALQPDFKPSHPTWDLMWRNCYRIPKNVLADDVNLKVFKGLSGREGTSSSLDYQNSSDGTQQFYLQITGLDQYNNNREDVKTPDDRLDDLPAVFRPRWGLIIFPHREPFNTDTTFIDQAGKETVPLADKVPNIYNYLSPADKTDNSKYYIQVSTHARSSVIRLGRANIIEDSERITLNGRLLKKGTDYNIQYDFGQVTLLTSEAEDPNADLQIQFEYAPFLSLQKKTLLGFRAEYEWSRDLKFGSTVLYKTDKAQDRKPRVGQETAQSMVIDFDVSFGLYPYFLTKVVNALPLVSTDAPSKLTVSAEVAQSRPNPNVEGEAYIDDFEAAVEFLSLGKARTTWTQASFPLELESKRDEYKRATIRWHNPPDVNRQDVYAEQVAAGSGSLTPLRLIFRPRGTARVTFPDGTCMGDSTYSVKSWGGIMRHFGSRVDEKRVQLFEIRAKGGKGLLHLDFGRISEDINDVPNGFNDTEDLSVPRNFALDDGEDTGLDNRLDAQEVSLCGETYNATTNPDPAGDNWWFNGIGSGTGSDNERPPVPNSIWTSPGFSERVENIRHYLHYEWQNGTEGNIRDDAVQGRPDEEALSQTFEENSAYFSFTLSLDPTPDNPFLVEGTGDKGWFTYQIPIREPDLAKIWRVDSSFEVGWEDISHVRIWFENEDTFDAADSMAHFDSILIADWGFVQSNWQDSLVNVDPFDSTEFYLASVTEADGTFSPPPGVEPYVDKVQNVTEAQRGLALVYNSLDSGDVALATKNLVSTESYSGYRRLEMFVHGPDTSPGSDSVMFFLRVGRDSVNYYEYQSYIKPGWNPTNHINMDLNVVTALKDAAERALDDPRASLDTTDFPYHVVGRPNINEVRFFETGVKNMNPNQPVSGRIWMDELRVTDVRRDIGTAARVSVTGSLADLITYQAGYERRDPYFRGLSEATRGGSSNNLGSGKESISYNYGGTLHLQKLLPRAWNARIPIAASYFSSETIPLLRTRSDVVLPDDVRQKEKSTSKSYKFSVSESFGQKGSNPIFNYFLNRQTAGFSYNRSERSSVNTPFVLGENYNIRSDFDMGIRKDVTIPIFFWTKPVPLLKKIADSRMSLFPNSWTWRGVFNRSLRVSEDKDAKRTSSFSRTLDGSMNLSYKMFTKLTTSYNFSTKRDLTDPDKVNFSLTNPRLGTENNYSQSFNTSYPLQPFNFITSSWTYSSNYSDNYDKNSRTRSSNLTRNWSVSGQFQHLVLLGRGGKRKKVGQSGGRGAVRGGGGQSEVKEKGSPFYEPVLVGMRFLTGWLNPLTYRYNTSLRKSAPGLIGKAAWKYRMGLQSDPGVPIGKTNHNPSSGETEGYEFGSGFHLLGGISTTVGYGKNVSRDLIAIGRDKFEKSSTGWPNVTLRIQEFTYLPFIKNQVNWFIRIFTPRTSFSRQLTENVNMTRGFTKNRSETIARSPLLALTLKLFRNLSLSGTVSNSSTIDENFNQVSGELLSETRRTRKSLAFSSKYAFTAPGGIKIPLLGRLKFKSMVSLNVNVKYNANHSETSNDGINFEVGTEKSDFSVSPVLSYTFSQQIRGGITAYWQDNNDSKFNSKSHVRQLQAWTEIKF